MAQVKIRALDTMTAEVEIGDQSEVMGNDRALATAQQVKSAGYDIDVEIGGFAKMGHQLLSGLIDLSEMSYSEGAKLLVRPRSFTIEA
jgi:hypothetical protein